ncbi:MAG: OmpH family outer membrane protein [Bacteroidota bacterium]
MKVLRDGSFAFRRAGLLAAMLGTALFWGLFAGQAARGETKKTTPAETVGYFDLERVKAEMQDFKDLQKLKETFEQELTKFSASERQKAAAYYAELEKKKEKELEKSEANKQAIERKYEGLARDRAAEINKAVQEKRVQLQARLDAETAKLDARLHDLAAAVAKAKNLKIILVKAVVFHGGVDVTKEIITRGNKEGKGK